MQGKISKSQSSDRTDLRKSIYAPITAEVRFYRFTEDIKKSQELFSNALLLYVVAFLVLFIIFISLDVLNAVLSNEEYLLKYAEIFSSFVLTAVTVRAYPKT
jgi:hypothetical protein